MERSILSRNILASAAKKKKEGGIKFLNGWARAILFAYGISQKSAIQQLKRYEERMRGER